MSEENRPEPRLLYAGRRRGFDAGAGPRWWRWLCATGMRRVAPRPAVLTRRSTVTCPSGPAGGRRV